jgi:phosphate transport system protein
MSDFPPPPEPTPGRHRTRQALAAELHRLSTELVEMGGICQEMLDRAVIALDRQDLLHAGAVLRLDDEVDRRALDVQRRTLVLIALQQPQATDLRTAALLLRGGAELERCGDYAAEIAGHGARLAPFRPAPCPRALLGLAALTTQMIRDTVDALVERDAAAVDRICREQEPAVDAGCAQVIAAAVEAMRAEPARLEVGLAHILSARAMERIAGHCTNVAEWTLYLISGVWEELA